MLCESNRQRGPGLNFINVLHTAVTHPDPESVKFKLSRQYLFTLLGSMRAKAERKMLVKLILGGHRRKWKEHFGQNVERLFYDQL
jgi:hypothetical protein